MNVREAARIFHDWAYKEGFLSEMAASPTSTDAQMALVTPISDVGKQILRAKFVQMIGFDEQTHSITVFTRRAKPNKKQIASLPDHVDDVTIQYRQGLQHGIGEPPAVPFGAPFTVRQVGTVGHYTCGSSISVGNTAEAGTLGALVRDGTGTLFGLSNNHISGSCSFAPVGMPILAPGVLDVTANSLPPFSIGFHRLALPLLTGTPTNVNHSANLDAAIFAIANPLNVSSFQGAAYDTPAVAAPIVTQQSVEKVGRTTGHTSGVVHSEIYGAASISYRCPTYGFTGPVFFEPLFVVYGLAGRPFSEGGDSGSLVTSVDAAGNRVAVGLIVGGGEDSSAPGGKTSLVLPIEPVLAGLGITLVSGHNI